MKLLALVFIFSSCQLFNGTKLSNDPQKEILKVCLKGSGDGRVIAGNTKFPFNYEMGLEDNLWLMALQFPFKDEVVVEVDLKSNKYIPNFERELLKSANGINPKVLRILLKLWSKNIFDIYQAKLKKIKASGYTVDSQNLSKLIILKSGYKLKTQYNSLVDDSYFKWFEVTIEDLKSKTALKIQTRVRECLK